MTSLFTEYGILAVTEGLAVLSGTGLTDIGDIPSVDEDRGAALRQLGCALTFACNAPDTWTAWLRAGSSTRQKRFGSLQQDV